MSWLAMTPLEAIVARALCTDVEPCFMCEREADRNIAHVRDALATHPELIEELIPTRYDGDGNEYPRALR